ncbi:unnamed protein product, partial [Choristocarpus tenellus]
AFHQECLSPPLKADSFPSVEEDWFCWQCECLLDCLDMLEGEFQGRHFNTWHAVFPEAEAPPEGEDDHQKGVDSAVLYAEGGSDTEEDGDFEVCAPESDGGRGC